jgi:predicted O-methyltransferase YrrM
MSQVQPSQRNPVPTSIVDWTRSDEYHNSFLISPDEALDAAKVNSARHGLPDISTAQGKYLKLLALSLGAKRILEVGTLAGCVQFLKAAVEWSRS